MKTPRRDIELRNLQILKLYWRGVSRKQIAAKLKWVPVMSYEAIKKVIQKALMAIEKGDFRP